MVKNLMMRELTLCIALAAISALVQLFHFGYEAPFMWIDVVATPWVIAFFLFGMRGAIITSIIGFVVIALLVPSTWIGASMKCAETLSMCLVLYLWLQWKNESRAYYRNFINVLIPLVIAVIMRAALAVPLNYYYAIPLYSGLAHAEAIGTVTWYSIVALNIMQGIVDVGVAWIVVFWFKLSRFAVD
jgi:riboflavin transporter FmnP